MKACFRTKPLPRVVGKLFQALGNRIILRGQTHESGTKKEMGYIPGSVHRLCGVAKSLQPCVLGLSLLQDGECEIGNTV